jgi:hypothetical protein
MPINRNVHEVCATKFREHTTFAIAVRTRDRVTRGASALSCVLSADDTGELA